MEQLSREEKAAMKKEVVMSSTGQECAAFAEWVCGGHGNKKRIYAYEGDGCWRIYTPNPASKPKITTEQLYELYTQSLNK